MRILTNKQGKIAKRQELLSEMIPGAISCDYIASVDRLLPNGYEVKSININTNGYAYYMYGFKNGEGKHFVSNRSVNIQGVNVYYIIID